MVRALRQWVEVTCDTVEARKQAWEGFSRNYNAEDRREVQREEREMIDDLNTWVEQYHEEVHRHLDFASLDWEMAVSQLEERLGGFDDLDARLENVKLDIEWQHRQQGRYRAAGRPI
ncbi:MAG: hypothetical protein Q9171_004174 [Xanthocarpia ochracea]